MGLLGIVQIFVFFCALTSASGAEEEASVNITPKIYSNIFVRKREEHRLVRTHLRITDNYEKQFTLLKMAYEKILQVIRESRKVLKEEPLGKKLPANQTEMEALFLLLENTCLFGDLVLHMPDISYRVLEKTPKWREVIDWAWKVTVRHELVIDERTMEMLKLFNQEINPDERSDNFVNPYRQEGDQTSPEKTKPTKKIRKKLKRGPQLTGGQRSYEDL
uniref:Putative erk and jnk pathways n=1 Tax=Phlebotomus kandelakii TaxID=1109342 RepID=A0A6B2E7K3_9DIPT